MKPKKPKVFNIKAFTIATLRRASYRLPARQEALKAGRIARNQYRCAKCLKIYSRKEVVIDHINPIVPLTGWDNFDGYIQRLFCAVEELQILCRVPCHKEKSLEENRIRREYVKKYKNIQ